MLAEVVPGIVVPFLIGMVVIVLGHFYKRLSLVTISMGRWLFYWSLIGFAVPSTILLAFPPNTALNEISSRLLWPTNIMLMAADPFTPKSGAALVVGISIVANVVTYLAIGAVVWTVTAWKRV